MYYRKGPSADPLKAMMYRTRFCGSLVSGSVGVCTHSRAFRSSQIMCSTCLPSEVQCCSTIIPTHARWPRVPEKEHDPHYIPVMVADRPVRREFVSPIVQRVLVGNCESHTVAFDATGGVNLAFESNLADEYEVSVKAF